MTRTSESVVLGAINGGYLVAVGDTTIPRGQFRVNHHDKRLEVHPEDAGVREAYDSFTARNMTDYVRDFGLTLPPKC